MYKNYIWDFDGTLYDTYPVMLECILSSLAKDFAISGDGAKIYFLLKNESSAAVAREYALDFTEFTQKFKALEMADLRQPQPFLQVREVLTAIIQRGGQHFILTHRTQQSTIEMLAKEGLNEYFVEIIGSEQPFTRKPNPTSLLYLMDKYQLDPVETVMIGDRKLDVDAGKNAGMQTIFFDNEKILTNIQADHYVTELTQIIAL